LGVTNANTERAGLDFLKVQMRNCKSNDYVGIAQRHFRWNFDALIYKWIAWHLQKRIKENLWCNKLQLDPHGRWSPSKGARLHTLCRSEFEHWDITSEYTWMDKWRLSSGQWGEGLQLKSALVGLHLASRNCPSSFIQQRHITLVFRYTNNMQKILKTCLQGFITWIKGFLND
jgi:hypothetical protein